MREEALQAEAEEMNQGVVDRMSFGEAFSLAHDSGEDTFRWRGRLYTTKREDKSESKARKQAKLTRQQEGAPDLTSAENFQPLAPVLGALSSGNQAIVDAIRPAYDAMAPMREALWGDQTPGGMLSEAHRAAVGKLQDMNADYSTWDRLRQMSQDYTTSDQLGIPRGLLDPRAWKQWILQQGQELKARRDNY